jgi:hypothetical protein
MIPHRYQPLQYHHDCVPILTLHSSLNDSDPIIYTIQHARLSQGSLEYEAVSYTWGNVTPKKTIQFNDSRREMLVGENCHNALRRLRLRHMNRLLWIDAICINQKNLAERARQVRIMNIIFSCAFNVVVILSDRVSNTGALFDELAAVETLLSLGEEFNQHPPNNAIIQDLETHFEEP